MEALKDLLPLAIALSLGMLVFAVGLDAEPGEFLYVLRRPRRLLRAILAVNVVVPLAALVLVTLLPISPAARAGVLLMAVSPAPPLLPGKQLKLGGRKAYSYGLYAALVLLAVVMAPVWVAGLDALYPAQIGISALAVARNAGLTVLAPLALGQLIRRLAPRAMGLAPRIRAFAMLLLLVACLPVIARVMPAVFVLAGDGSLLVMALTVVAGLAAGTILGGSDIEDRAALAAAAAIRHPGLALLIARTNTEEPEVAAAILAFLLIGILVRVPYQMIVKRRRAALTTGYRA